MSPISKRSLFFESIQIRDEWLAVFTNVTRLRDVHDEYIFGEIIGKGQFGKVYEATPKYQSHSVFKVAIKVVKLKELSKNEADIVRKEIETLMACADEQCENIVRLLDHFEDESTIYLVLELINSIDLKKYLLSR